ncbi:probable Ufm1-specific protease [Benincasa hispida]|uniref:probable Ufm1-specific protease n=1 Tax=Benincasa hispida TaxID=102211 RepID=UPI0018FFE4A8|nr:probable Ufm1-specific protease [Benincasa hispida]
MEEVVEQQCIRILPHKLVLQKKEPALQWLIGSPFLSPLTIVSTLRCIHHLSPPESLSPDFTKEAEELRTLLLKGFYIIGALVVGNFNVQEHASNAIDAARRLSQLLSHGEKTEKQIFIGAAADINSTDIHFFVSQSENGTSLDSVSSVMYENNPEKYIWERGCLLRCELPISIPLYFPLDSPSDVEKTYIHATESVISKLRDSQVVYIVEPVYKNSTEDPCPVILRGSQMDFQINLSKFRHLDDGSQNVDDMSLPCANFCLKSKTESSTFSSQNADIIHVSVLLNSSAKSQKSIAPVVKYFPAMDKTSLLVVDLKAEVLCYAAKFLPLTYAVSALIIPGLVDQLNSMKNAILPNLVKQLPQLVPYHFCPPGFFHPITVIYELTYGETEMKQGIVLSARATDHLTSSSELFMSYNPSVGNERICIADRSFASVAGKDHISPFDGLILHDTLHVPKITYNLFSVSKITKDLKCKEIFSPNSTLFQDLKSGMTIGTARHDRGLYFLSEEASFKDNHQTGFMSLNFSVSENDFM